MIVEATANSPHRFSCEDGNDYAVKPRSADQQFANELLALALGTLVGIPLFDAAIVTVTVSFLVTSPAATALYAPGIHFGSRVPTTHFFNFDNVAPALVQTHIRNANEFYRLAMFDELIANVDRANNRRNLVAVELYPDQPKNDFFAIDHGHTFTGPGWTVSALETHVPMPVYPVLNVVRDFLDSRARLDGDAQHVAGFLADFEAAIDAAQSGLDDRARRAVLHLLTLRAPQLSAWIATPGYAAHLPNLH